MKRKIRKRTPEEQRKYDDRTILIKGTGWTVGHQVRYWQKYLQENRTKKKGM